MKVFYDEVVHLVEKHKPQIIFIEDIYHRAMQTTKALARMRGICEIACINSGVDNIQMINASHARSVVVQKGNAQKEDICTIMEARFKRELKTNGYDKSDAILIGLCGVKEYANVKKNRNNE